MIRLTREVRFSVDRDWAGRIEPGSRVTNSWAGWPSAVGIVPFLCLRATLAGEPDPRSGYVCNIARIDELLRQAGLGQTAGLAAAAKLSGDGDARIV
jgi:6-pyruvoyltetrahydropterin/6-carboxytetrahydropterin synthase